jgi:sugar lactone lactonase YvrE
VYVSDSEGGAVLHLAPGADSLAVLVESGWLVSAQGLALAGGGSTLYVADYSTGVHVVDLTSGAIELLEVSGDATLLGIDGLVAHGDALIGIQNGIRPQRVVRIRPGAGPGGTATVETLVSAHPLFDEPTLGCIVGDRLVYVGASGWAQVDRQGELHVDEMERDPVILELTL